MYQPLIRLHKSFPAVVTVCLLSLPLLQAGCEGDVDAADKQVRQQLSEGAQKTDAAVTSAPTVPAAYKQAAGVTKASPAVRVEALLRVGGGGGGPAPAAVVPGGPPFTPLFPAPRGPPSPTRGGATKKTPR